MRHSLLAVLGGLLLVAPARPASTASAIATTVLRAADADSGDAFGRRVAVSDNTILVGANGDDERGTDAGAAYIFERDATGAWVQRQKLLPPELRAGDFFGWSVAIKGDVAVVGAPGDDRDSAGAPSGATPNRGAAYVFRRTGTQWIQEARLQPQVLGPGDEFGIRVAVDPPFLLASARYHDGQPSRVLAYLNTPQGWQIDGPLTSTWGDHSGFSLDLEAGVAAVGALDPSASIVHRYVRPVSAWIPFFFAVYFAPPRDGLAEVAKFSAIRGIGRWPDGSVVVLDEDSRSGPAIGGAIRKVTPDGRVTTLFTVGPGQWWIDSDALETDDSGVVYLATRETVRKRLPDGTEPVIATGFSGLVSFARRPSDGVMFVGDRCAVRQVATDGTVTTIAGATDDCRDVDGPGSVARFTAPVVQPGPGNVLYVGTGTALRHIDLGTNHVTTLAPLANVTALTVDETGTLYLAGGGGRVYRWTGAALVEIAGSGPSPYLGSFPVDGTGSAAVLSTSALVSWSPGLLAFTEREVTRTATTSGTVTTIAGTPTGYWTDEFFSYDVAVQGNRMLVGSPRSPGTFTGTVRSGRAWVFEWQSVSDQKVPATIVPPRNAEPYSRYGGAVAFTTNGDIVLGPANGCLWTGPGACGDDTYGTAWFNTVFPIRLYREDADGRWPERAVLPTTGVLPRSGYGNTLSSDGRWLVTGAAEWDFRPQDGPPYGEISGPGAVYVYDLDTLDSDGDGLTDTWEEQFGLNSTDPADAALDADGDGVTNAEEFAARTHPTSTGVPALLFAEGATSSFFETELSISNPGTDEAVVNLRFLKATGEVESTVVQVPAQQSRKVLVGSLARMAVAEFATQVESDHPVVVDRMMWWDGTTAWGSHGAAAADRWSLTSPPMRPTWYLAEGATHSGFELFYLLQNPNPSPVLATITYLRPSGSPLVKSYALPPVSRTTIWVNQEEFPAGSGDRALASAEVAAIVQTPVGVPQGPTGPAQVPIVVERAMYRTRPGADPTAPGVTFEAGHASAAIAEPSRSWFFAEGATGTFFDEFLLLANPGTTAVTVDATYLLTSGQALTARYVVAPTSRFTIWVDQEEIPPGSGLRPLADVAGVSVQLTGDGDFLAERAMWWPGPTYATWTEAHNSPGATERCTLCATGAGAVRGTPRTDTYYLIANTDPTTAADVRVTLLFDDGGPAVSRTVTVGPQSRFTVDARTVFPESVNRGFGATFESLGASPVPILVEWAIYNDALGGFWAAGANGLATKVQ